MALRRIGETISVFFANGRRAIFEYTLQNFQKRICPSAQQLIKTQIKLTQSHIKRVIALTLTLKTLKILTFVVEHTMKLKNYIKKFHVRVRI